MPALGALFPIDGPLPVAPPHGLLQAAQILEDFDLHMFNGAAVYPYPVAVAQSYNPRAEGTNALKDEGEMIDPPRFAAFTVYLAAACTSRGIGNDQQFRDRATAVLAASESKAVELEFATGDQVGDNPHLTDAQANVLGTFDEVESLIALEEAIAATGRVGMIHADPGTVTAWIAANLIPEDTPLTQPLRTGLGTVVVSGAGYMNVFPQDEAPAADGEGWAFATGPVQIRRSAAEIVPNTLREATDRETNWVVFRAERNYIVTWDTALQAAVLVDRN